MFTKIATATVLLLSSCVALAQAREGALLENADSDHDGKVTRQEFTAARAAQFAKLDSDNDGFVDDAAAGGQRAAAVRGRLDRDGDGKISKEEFVDGPALLFTRFDADHNDVLDAKELQAARSAAQERFRQRRQQ